jgi:hypothetical protein
MSPVGQTRRVESRVGLGYGLGFGQTNPRQTRARGAGLAGYYCVVLPNNSAGLNRATEVYNTATKQSMTAAHNSGSRHGSQQLHSTTVVFHTSSGREKNIIQFSSIQSSRLMMPATNPDPPDDSLGPQKRRVPLDDNGEPVVPPKKRKSAAYLPDQTKEQTSQKNPATNTKAAKSSTSSTKKKSRAVEIEEVDDPEAAPRASSRHTQESTDDEDLPEVIEQPEEDDEEELSE